MYTVKLRNGVEMPVLGYGSGIVKKFKYINSSKKIELKYYIRNFLKDKKQWKADSSLPKIIKSYNHPLPFLLDTSISYAGSEEVIGKSIRKMDRDNIFITTKVGNKEQYGHAVKEAFEQSRKKLGVDTIDLYLMHWPVKGEYIDTWKRMEEIFLRGGGTSDWRMQL